MRDFLQGLFLAELLLVSCAIPSAECGGLALDGFDGSPPPAGKCSRLTVDDGGTMGKDACSSAPCVVLMPGESATATMPPDSNWAMGGTVTVPRENAWLDADGSCPLTCD